MKKAIMIRVHRNIAEVKKFNTVTEAYHYYLKNYSSFGEWWYYLRCAHCLLSKVTNEEIMKSVFENVFDENVCLVMDK